MKALLAALLMLLLLAASEPVTVSVSVQRASDDLLEPVTISIALRNNSPQSILATFLTTDVYQMEVRNDREKVWDSLYNTRPLTIERRIPLHTGTTPLVSYIWDGTTNDHRSVAPGTYTLRVSILGSILHPTAEVPLVFATPTPIRAAFALKPGSGVTVEGEARRLSTGLALTDESGTIALNRGLGPNPQGLFIVRGFVQKDLTGTSLQVSHFAPAFENTQVQSPPTPPGPLIAPTPRRTPQ